MYKGFTPICANCAHKSDDYVYSCIRETSPLYRVCVSPEQSCGEFGVRPKVYYHGEHAPQMFSYDCGACGYPLEGKERVCRGCGLAVAYRDA